MRSVCLSVCAVLGLLILPIHNTGDEYNSMMGVNTIFHWRFTGKSDVPSVRLRVSAVPDRTVAGRRSVWGEDSADCLETTTMLCNRPALDVSDAFTSHLLISVIWGRRP